MWKKLCLVVFHVIIFKENIVFYDKFILKEIYFYLTFFLSIHPLNYTALSLRELLTLFLNLLVSALCNLKHSVTKDDA